MAAIIGIEAFCPIAKENYILIATDSQINLTQDSKTVKRIISLDAKKVFHNTDKSLIFTYTGNVLRKIELKFYEEKLEEKYQKYNNTIDSLFRSTKTNDEMAKKLFDSLQEFKPINQYLFATSDNNLMLYNNTNVNKISATTIGLSVKLISQNFNNEINKYQKIVDTTSQLILSPSEAILLAYQQISEASKMSAFTGGHFNWMIKTKHGVYETKTDTKLGINESIINRENAIISLNPLYQKRNIKSIQELVFSKK